MSKEFNLKHIKDLIADGCDISNQAAQFLVSKIEALQVAIDEANAQQSPAVAVPDVAALASRFEFSVESKVFEQYAERGKMNMDQHPVHYIFTDDHTGTARDAWRAAMNYAVKSLAECLVLPKSPRITEQERYPSASFLRNGEESGQETPFAYPNYESKTVLHPMHAGKISIEQRLADANISEIHIYKDLQHLKVIFSGDYLGLYDKDNKRVAKYKLEQES